MIWLPPRKRCQCMTGKKKSWPGERQTLQNIPRPDFPGRKSSEGCEATMAAELLSHVSMSQDARNPEGVTQPAITPVSQLRNPHSAGLWFFFSFHPHTPPLN